MVEILLCRLDLRFAVIRHIVPGACRLQRLLLTLSPPINNQDDYYDPYANPTSSMKLDWTEPNASADTSASTSKHSGVDAVDETDKMNTSDLNYDMQVRTCEN